ncbi:hypothetical protein U1Q18_021420 [Sarracenia purpurea var. burkii]
MLPMYWMDTPHQHTDCISYQHTDCISYLYNDFSPKRACAWGLNLMVPCSGGQTNLTVASVTSSSLYSPFLMLSSTKLTKHHNASLNIHGLATCGPLIIKLGFSFCKNYHSFFGRLRVKFSYFRLMTAF